MNANLQFPSRPTIQSSFPNAMKRFHSCVAPLWAALTVVLLGTCALQMSPVFGQANTDPPERMTYQGFLVDANGTILGNSSPKNYDVVFTIKDGTDGKSLWVEQQTVTVDKGYFSVLLGEGAMVDREPRPALSALFKGQGAAQRYIAIKVKGIGPGNTDVNILPSLQFLTSPYAFLAQQAQQALKLVKPNGIDLITIDATNDRESLNAIRVNGMITAQALVGDGSKLSGLNAQQLTGLLPEARLSGSVARRDQTNTFAGYVRVGALSTEMKTDAVAGYGQAVVFSGGPAFIGGFESDNTDPLWIARYNVSVNASELRMNIGDDNESRDKFVVGTTGGGGFNQIGTWTPKVTIDSRGYMGLQGRSAMLPLTFENTEGPKICLWGTTENSYFGFGIGPGRLQIRHADVGTGVSFGYETGGLFVETAGINATGLHVNNQVEPKIQLNRADGRYAKLYRTEAAVILTVNRSDWYTGVSHAIYNGDNNWDFDSDRKLKKDIVDAEPMLERALKVRVRNFRWKTSEADSRPMLGVIAQELEPLFPEMVTENEDPDSKENWLSVGYGHFAIIAIKAVQELKKQHDSEIADLKAQMTEIIQANKELRSRLAKGTVTASNAK